MMTGCRRTHAAAVVLLVLGFVAPRDAVAQAGTGTLTGRIIDAQGASIPVNGTGTNPPREFGVTFRLDF